MRGGAKLGASGTGFRSGSIAHLRTEPQLRSDELWFFGFAGARKTIRRAGGRVQTEGVAYENHGGMIADASFSDKIRL